MSATSFDHTHTHPPHVSINTDLSNVNFFNKRRVFICIESLIKAMSFMTKTKFLILNKPQ